MPSPKYNRSRIIPLLGSLCVVTPFAIDMYLPAFTKIAVEFRTTTSEISLSLSTYLVGFALGQLAIGPLLDRFGRRRPLHAGLVIFILCSIGCAMATSLRVFAALRFLQALGGCAAQVGAIAMVRDFFPVRESAKIFSLLFLMIGISPLLAPTIGSSIVQHSKWQWIFVLLAVATCIVMTFTFFFLPEGHQPDPSVALRPGALVRAFWEIIKDRRFRTYSLTGTFSFAGLFAFVAGSPSIFMDRFHLNAKAFGIVFTVLVMGFIISNQANVLLLRKFTSPQILETALSFQVLTGGVFFIARQLDAIGLGATLLLFFIFLSCIGLTYPNATALGLARFSHNSGRASALLGFLQIGTGALISMAIGLLGDQAVIATLLFTVLIALMILTMGKRAIDEWFDYDS